MENSGRGLLKTAFHFNSCNDFKSTQHLEPYNFLYNPLFKRDKYVEPIKVLAFWTSLDFLKIFGMEMSTSTDTGANHREFHITASDLTEKCRNAFRTDRCDQIRFLPYVHLAVESLHLIYTLSKCHFHPT